MMLGAELCRKGITWKALHFLQCCRLPLPEIDAALPLQARHACAHLTEPEISGEWVQIRFLLLVCIKLLQRRRRNAAQLQAGAICLTPITGAATAFTATVFLNVGRSPGGPFWHPDNF